MTSERRGDSGSDPGNAGRRHDQRGQHENDDGTVVAGHGGRAASPPPRPSDAPAHDDIPEVPALDAAGTRSGERPSGGTIPIGLVIANTYRIESLIAIGGMGEVYRAEHLFNNRLYALKMLKPEFARDERIIELFRREAGVLESIRNRTVVGYNGLLLDDQNRPFIVMEYVGGHALSDLIGEHVFTVEEVRLLRDRIAGALDEAHQRGIVHRDISPDNIVLQDGKLDQPRLIDFGIARQETAAYTLIGDSFAGKFRYASPEQLGQFGGKVDGRSDIFSLGLVLMTIAQGRLIDLGGSPAEVLEQRRHLPDLSGVPAPLRAELTAMLQPDPNDRPARATDLVGAQPPGPGADGKTRGRGGWMIAAAVVLLLAAAAGGAAWILTSGQAPPPAPPLAEAEHPTPGSASATANATAAAPAAEPDPDPADTPSP